MKKKVLLYSDCYIYGGSERLMTALIRNKCIQEEYFITYAYRLHSLYNKGLKKEYTKEERKNFKGLLLLSNDTLFYKINLLPIHKIIRNGLKIPFWLFEKIGLYVLYNFVYTYFFIKKLTPDIVHINNGGYPAAKTCLLMVFVASSLGYRNIILQVNNLATNAKNIIFRWIDAHINKRVKYFITASKAARETLARNRCFPAEKIIQIPNTIINSIITKTHDEICTEHDIPINGFLICEVAFLEYRKGQHLLVMAMDILRKQYPDLYANIYLILVGSGVDEKKLRADIIDLGMTEHIVLTGYRQESQNYIAACDIFVLPSIASEDMPLVILSAMQLGKTIISTKFAGIKEEIEDGISGILFEPIKEQLPVWLAQAIVSLYNRNTDYGHNAKIRFETHFSNRIYAERIMNLYKQMEK